MPMPPPAEVRIRPGVYRLAEPLAFAPEDGGEAGRPVTWLGVGGRPLLSGGRASDGWRTGAINGVPCWHAVLPEVAAGRWWFPQLFVNGRRRLRALAQAGLPALRRRAGGGGAAR